VLREAQVPDDVILRLPPQTRFEHSAHGSRELEAIALALGMRPNRILPTLRGRDADPAALPFSCLEQTGALDEKATPHQRDGIDRHRG
jgi:hypothetical protein